MVMDSNFNGVVGCSLDEVIYLNRLNYKTFTYKVCKEHLLSLQAVLLFQKNFYLLNAVDKTISELKAAGLVHHWISKFIDPKFLSILQPDPGPKKLSVNHLLGGFEVWLCGLIAASILFAFELIIFEKKKKIYLQT